MAVAKSYQNMALVGEPYEVNGRMYVKVQAKTGEKQVRWYTDAEYAKMYGAPAVNPKFLGADGLDHSKDPFWKSQKDLLGFKNGYITIFSGPTYENKEWFKEQGCVFRKLWGWSLSSEEPELTELPEGIKAHRLEWASVGNDELEQLKPDKDVLAAVESLIYEPGSSEYVGAPGERITVEVTVVKNVSLDGYYGTSHMHIMEDADGNQYVWNTTAKDWEEGSNKVITGTIKEHKTYRNQKQTVLTRCKEA